MPRAARLYSKSGIYHIILRGINRQQIFEDEEDRKVFLRILREYKTECGYKLLAYCLMDNHIHLLMKEGDVPLGQMFKRIGACFVYWYNTKYQRVGHLFQDRFRSEVVENLAYLYTVINYIHQNPVKAGICSHPEKYLYSSFPEYLGHPGLVDLDFVEQYISKETVVEMSRKPSTEECLEMADTPQRRVTDQQAKKIIMEIAECDSVSAFQALEPAARDDYILKLKRSGLSIRQISRLTGASYYIIQKIR